MSSQPCCPPRATHYPAYLPGYIVPDPGVCLSAWTCQNRVPVMGPVRTVLRAQVSQSSLSWPIYRRSRHRRGPTKTSPPCQSLHTGCTPSLTYPPPPSSHVRRATLGVIALQHQGTQPGALAALAVPCRRLSWVQQQHPLPGRGRRSSDMCLGRQADMARRADWDLPSGGQSRSPTHAGQPGQAGHCPKRP